MPAFEFADVDKHANPSFDDSSKPVAELNKPFVVLMTWLSRLRRMTHLGMFREFVTLVEEN